MAANQQNPTVSASISAESTNQALDISKGTHFVDETFPLFSTMFQQVKIPILVVYPFLTIFFIQVLFVSVWPFCKYWEQYDSLSLLKWLKTVLFYVPHPTEPTGFIIVSAVIFFINLISMIMIRFQMGYYKIKRKFIKFLNFPIRFYFETILVATLCPVIMGVGESFYSIAKGDRDPRTIIAFILFILSDAYESYSFTMVQEFAAKSVWINISPLLNFDPTIMTLVIITMNAILIPFFVLLLFEYWAFLFALVIHFAIFAYLMGYLIMRTPFVDLLTNSMGVAWYVGCLLGDGIMFVATFYQGMHYVVPLLGALVGFMGTIPAFMIYFILREKSIVKSLAEEIKNQDEANDYYTQLGIDKNADKALLYLRLAFQNCLPNFYNWTLMNFIVDHHDTENILATSLQILNFFPKETRLQNKIQRIILKRRKLKPSTRFLLYQVDAVKTLRQFSVSTASKLKLIELKTMSRHCEMLTKGAIDNSALEPHYFEQLAISAQSARAIWKEALLGSPNNPKFCEEYTRYLIECECDFPEGLKMKHRQQVIEMGNSFSVDHSFRSMVAAFPKYLTQKILDLQGGVIKKKLNEPKGSQSNNTSANSNSQGSFQSTVNDEALDAELEEYVGKQTMTLSRTRLALHRTLENKLPKSIKVLKPVAAFVIIYVIACFVFGNVSSSMRLNDMVKSMDQLDTISKTRFYLALSNVHIIFSYIKANNALNKYLEVLKGIQPTDRYLYVNLFENLISPTVNLTARASKTLDQFTEILSDLALKGTDVSKIASVFMNPELYIASCRVAAIPVSANQYLPYALPVLVGRQPLYSPASLSTLMAGALANQREFSGETTAMYLMQSPATCEVSLNFKTIYIGSTEIFGNISAFQNEKGENLKSFFAFVSILVPIITFFIAFVPFIVIHFMTLNSLKQIVEIIKSFDSKAKSDAKEMILIQSGTEDQRMAEMHTMSKASIVYIFIIGVISVIFLAMTLIGCRFVVEANKNIININGWNQFASARLSLTAETLNLVATAIAKKDIVTSYLYTDKSLINIMLQILSKSLIEAENSLIDGTKNTVPCQGFDSTLDNLNIVNQEITSQTDDPVGYYSKVSIHQQVSIFTNYINIILEDSISNKTEINKEAVANAINIANAYLFERMFQVTQQLLVLAQQQYKKIMLMFYVCAAVLVVLSIIFVIVIAAYYNNRASAYKAALFVVKRFSPYALLNNKMFSKIFLKGKDQEKDDRLSTEGLIIRNANDPIFCTNLLGVVEIVNNSVSTLLGYTPEQILGQNVSSFFATIDMDKISQKMEQMKTGQSSSFYEDDYTVVSDASKDIPVHVTIIGMKKDKDTDVTSFVVILRDQTALVEQKKAAEEAKAKSEKLLYQILPRDIVVQLNRGEKDISFVVPSATIIFIDINKFSEYAANLSPQDIMANLSYYFACIDKLAAKHTMITKIKLIGDIYMAAAGLFNHDSPPESHAEQVIQFAIECVSILDEVNIKLDASLQIRIGINTGGPVIAGVLGTDKPAFDIIGDPINIAARLQSTDEVNHVHISQSTFDLIRGSNYEVTQRGETFLKGKGKQMTYYVTVPPTVFNATGSQVFRS